jgi:hypothetical protein
MDLDDLNPPLSPAPKSDTFFGLILWGLLLWGIVSFARWLF